MAEPPPDTVPQAGASVDRRAGTVLGGRYRFERLVASGGMAQVWSATDTLLDREVAVKLLHEHLAEDTGFIERFRREAIAAARLAHPGIVAIYDTHSGPDGEAIVMELVRGHSLRARLDTGPIPPREAVEIGAQVADALDVAHRAGLVHRDIKPANILLCDDQRVMVADFGIAKLTEATDHTNEGTMLGTAKYLAPEQVEGARVDARSDVYAVGVLVYEMVCGSPPFQADTDAATALARLHRDPDPMTTHGVEVSPALEAVVARAMARDPDDRFATAGELRAALVGAGGRPSKAVSRPPAEAGSSTAAAPPPGDGDATFVEPGGEPTPPAGVPSFTRSERRWLVPAMLILLVAVALGVAGALLGDTIGDRLLSGDDGAPADGSGAAVDLVVTGTESFDPPPGDGEESDEVVAAVADGDPETFWASSGYDSFPWGGIKDGVGVVLRLDARQPVESIEVASPSQGWSGEVYVADDVGTDLAAWGQPVAKVSGSSSPTSTFEFEPATGSTVLVWFTEPATAPDDDGRFRIRVSEIAAR